MKPMLAATPENLEKIELPCLASVKLDGIRGVITSQGIRSRKLKKFPNQFVSNLFSRPELEGLDGELIRGIPYGQGVFNRSQSAVMNSHGTPDVDFYVFDVWNVDYLPFRKRHQYLRRMLEQSPHPFIKVLEQKYIETYQQLVDFENEAVDQGYEGLITRSPDGLYKFGRSTVREQGMLKVKRFLDSEAEILELIEEQENQNVGVRDAIGRLKRSSSKAGKVGKGRTGSVRAKDVFTGKEINCTIPSLEAKADPRLRVGSIFTYKYRPPVIPDGKPFHLTFKDFRDDGY